MKTRILIACVTVLAMPLMSTQTGWSQDTANKAPEGFTALFDGKSLAGWEQKNGTATYEVVEGTIKGTTAEGSPNSFLCSKKEFADFELHFEVKVDDKLNSGVQIRSLSKDDYKKGRVHGPQVEIEAGPGESGYLYSEGTGRGWISPEQPVKNAFKNGEWNKYRVIAEGARVRTWVNGTYVEDLELPDVESRKGFIGLQVHGLHGDLKKAGPFHVQWKNIFIREFDGTETRTAVAHRGTPKIDGKMDKVWESVPYLATSREVEEHNQLSSDRKVSRAKVRCLWDDDYLYCLAVVSDDKISISGYESWQQDSVEFFVDPNMSRSTSYDDDDAQYRTNADNKLSCGDSSDLSNYKSAVTKIEGGYIVEAAIKLDTKAGKKIGFDVQVNNDPGVGDRHSTAKWNDDTNETYNDMSLMGTLELKGK